MSPSIPTRVRTLSFVSICIVFVVVALVWTSRQHAAASITVNSLLDVADSGDGLCTLREAITAANNNTASGGVGGECVAGDSSGTDTIDLTALNGTITLTSALPAISSDITITGPGVSALTLSGNNAFRVLQISSGTVSVADLTIANGNVPAFPGGAGILNGGNLTLTRLYVRDNVSVSAGGGIATNGGTTNIIQCLVATNTANSGGGIAAKGGTVTISNTTISGNTASGLGGGVLNDAGPVTLTNVTITDNRTTGVAGNGGGYRVVPIGTTTFNNTIVAGNFVGASPSTTPDDISAGSVGGSFNLIGTGGSGGLSNGVNGNQVGVSNPGLAALANNGGPTQTHALLGGSLALDAGSNTLAANVGLTTDQRGAGFNRVVDGPDADVTDTVDIGAFESQVWVENVTDKATNEDTQLQFTFNVSASTSLVTASSSNATLVPNAPANIAVSGSGSTRTLTINPAANQFGTSTISVSVSAAGGESMTDTFVLTVNPVADTPSVTNATTTVNTQSTSGLVISRNAADGNEVANFKITNIQNGTLFKNNGTTQINNNDFITFAEGNAGLKFTPASNLLSPGTTFSFNVQASLNNTNAGLGGANATATITVNCGPTVVANSNDSGAGSLRATINSACVGATITFDMTPGQVTSPITLTSGELAINKDLTITGPAANQLTISGNNSSRVFNIQSGQVSISKLTIANGNTSASPGGGGIANNGNLTLSDCAVLNSNTTQSGGALATPFPSSGTTTINRCLFANNSSSFGGGALAFLGGTVTVNNSTISGNTAGSTGGGAFKDFATVTFTNVTITNNRGITSGGGYQGLGASVPTLRNSIIAGNFRGAAPSTTPDDLGSNVDAASSFNLIGTGGSSGLTNGTNSNQVGVNPLLTALANNGGPTQTHAFMAGSPALDAGSNTLASNAGLTTDQRGAGFLRVVDGPDGNTTDTVDIGAFEAQIFVDDVADKTTNEDTQLQFGFNVGGSISSVTATSSNTALVPNNSANLDVSGSGSSRTLTINPAVNQSGTSTITLTVNAASGESMTDTFVLTVSAVADTPSVTNATTNEDVQSASGLVLSRNAADGAEVTHFKISSITNGALFKNNGVTAINNGDFITFSEGNAGLKFTPAANLNSASSSFSFQVQAATSSGGSGLSASLATATITVNAVNDPPSFSKGGNQTINEDAGAQTVIGFVTAISPGPGNESGQTVTLTVTNNNNTLFSTQPAVGSNGDLTYTPAANANGSATVTVTAKDDGGVANGGNDTSPPQTFTITVSAVNDPPSFTKGADQTVNNNAGAQTVPNWATSISAGPGNESSQTLTFQVTGNTNSGLFSAGPAFSSTGTLTYTPASNAGGTATITINLKDNGGTTNGGVDTSASQTFTITITPAGGFVNFASSTGNITENSGSTTVNVVRTGDTSTAVTVNYGTNADAGVPCSTANGVASPKCDFTAALGTLSFAAGETSKPITILLSQDSFVEGPETITLTLSSPTSGAALGTPSTMSVTIADDATESPTNIIDDANMFVRMHYHDFLNREADQSGLDFWTGQMTNCGNSDLTVCRVNVSGAFFLSIEFQQTGYLIERMYKTAYSDATATSQLGGSHQIFVPVVRANEFLTDTQRIGRGVVVLQPGWETVLENNKQAYALEFVQTSRFISGFPTSMTPAQFVDKLNTNAGNVLSASERTTAINLFGNAANTTNVNARAQSLRQVAEDQDLYNAEFNRAFVLAEYIGYLRRNPNDAPEPTLDYTGYDFWLAKLNEKNGDYIAAEMVKAFITSSEYRQRFGP